jgi:hypothetical protein
MAAMFDSLIAIPLCLCFTGIFVITKNTLVAEAAWKIAQPMMVPCFH